MDGIWNGKYARGTNLVTSSIIRDLLHLTQRPAVISFGGGLPAPECFPTGAIQAATDEVFAEQPLAALQYGPTEGFMPLRAFVAEHMAALGAKVSSEQVLITSGSQQALDLLGRLMIDAGAPILVEDPTYLGALQAWRPHAPQFITVPVDEQGVQVDALERILQSGVHPRFFYIMSSFQNPMGVSLADERRHALIALAARYRLPIIEDDPYGELYYDGNRPTPLAAIDMQMHGELRHVAYLSSFSKLLSPGMRVGWIAASPSLLAKVAQLKQGMDLHTSSLSQSVVYTACRDGLLAAHVPNIRQIYRERRDTMLNALHRTMPRTVRWTHPHGGMFIWVTLPRYFDATALLQTALEYDVAYVPGTCFYANGGGSNSLRLNFSMPTVAQIEEGIARLGTMLHAFAHEKAA